MRSSSVAAPPPPSPPPVPLVVSSLAQAARAMLPASSRAAAFILRARRKTISSLGDGPHGRGGRSRWVGSVRDCRRAPGPPARDDGTLTAPRICAEPRRRDRDGIVANAATAVARATRTPPTPGRGLACPPCDDRW